MLLGEKKEPVRGWLYRKRTCNSIGEFQKNEQRTVASWATEKSQRREKAVLREGGQRIREVCYFNTNTVNLETAPPRPGGAAWAPDIAPALDRPTANRVNLLSDLHVFTHSIRE